MAISATFDSGQGGPESRRSKRASEIWLIVGATGAVDDTVAITTRYIKRNAKCVGGAFAFSTSGQVITLTAKVALANLTAAVEIIGDL